MLSCVNNIRNFFGVTVKINPGNISPEITFDCDKVKNDDSHTLLRNVTPHLYFIIFMMTINVVLIYAKYRDSNISSNHAL